MVCVRTEVPTQGFLWVGKDCGMAAWMLSSFIISPMSKHHLALQEDSLINLINIIWPGVWGSRYVRPEFSLAPAGTKKGKGAPGSRGKQEECGDRLPTGWESAAAHESPWSLSLAGVSSSASVRNILREEGDRVSSAEISKPNGGNLFYGHVTRSQTVPSVPSHQKKQAVTPSRCAALFLFSQRNKATSLTRAGEINLVRLCLEEEVCRSRWQQRESFPRRKHQAQGIQVLEIGFILILNQIFTEATLFPSLVCIRGHTIYFSFDLKWNAERLAT